MVYLEYFIASGRPLIYVRNKWRPETKPLGLPYMLIRSELKPFIEVYCFQSLIYMQLLIGNIELFLLFQKFAWEFSQIFQIQKQLSSGALQK